MEYKAKNNMYGIGFDPYTAAPEFRDRKAVGTKAPVITRVTMSSVFETNNVDQAGAFGIGAYEDADDDDVYGSSNMDMYDRELFDPHEKRSKEPKQLQIGYKKPAEPGKYFSYCSFFANSFIRHWTCPKMLRRLAPAQKFYFGYPCNSNSEVVPAPSNSQRFPTYSQIRCSAPRRGSHYSWRSR